MDRDQDFDATISACTKLLEDIEALLTDAIILKTAASNAEAGMRDQVALEDIQAVDELAMAIQKHAQGAKDVVEELRASTIRAKDEYDSL